MNKNIKFREIKESDYPIIANIIMKTWEFDEFCELKAAKELAKYYLYICLNDQTYTNIVTLNEIPIGVVMGKNLAKWKSSEKYESLINETTSKLFFNKEGRKALKFIRGIEEMNAKLLKNYSKNFQAELSLFILDSSYRGMGIGKLLFDKFLEYLKQEKITNFYLFTDTNSNYKFYEHYGMARLVEKKKSFVLGDEEEDITFYIYGTNI